MKFNIILAPVLIFMSSVVFSATIERPIFTRLKDAPLDDNPISSYVQFGTLSDGTQAITKTENNIALYYERDVFSVVNSTAEFFAVSEINCKTGMIQPIGFGRIERISAFKKALEPHHVKEEHPKNLSVYRQICKSLQMQPKF